MMTLPHFIVIGAAKAGTVSLYHYLQQHPQIYMSPQNEPNFFALVGMDQADWFHGPGDRENVRQQCVTELEPYKALFAGAQKSQMAGEVSPVYLYSKSAPGQIKAHIPQVRLLVLLRQPAERAFSHYQHFRRAGLEPEADFARVIELEERRIRQGWGPIPMWHYVNMGFYARQLQQYAQQFAPNQMWVGLYDDFVVDPTAVLRQMFAFIGVDEAWEVDTAVQHNLGGQPRYTRLHQLMTRPNAIKSTFNWLIPPSLRYQLRDTVHQLNSPKPLLDDACRARLNALYYEDILELQTMIGRDLSHWLT
ncbi:MAG: sulfotransferase domain-containing protein [Anaerolineae bacterium]|nr:sulfotransferase domain-containing protein [Anaerolineae bacterium]